MIQFPSKQTRDIFTEFLEKKSKIPKKVVNFLKQFLNDRIEKKEWRRKKTHIPKRKELILGGGGV